MSVQDPKHPAQLPPEEESLAHRDRLVASRDLAPKGERYVPDYAPDFGRERGFSLGRATLHYWWLVLLPVILLVGAAIAVGITQRTPIYTATAQLNVGSVDATAQAVPGYVEATNTLASSYSRVSTTALVLRPVARAEGTTITNLQSRITVSPLPDNPIIQIKAQGSSAVDAQRLASLMATTLTSYVKRSRADSDSTASTLRSYRRASTRLAREQSLLSSLKGRRSADERTVSSSRIESQQGEVDAAQLQVQTLSALYSQARQRNTTASGLSVLELPTSATSDRLAVTQRLGFVGLVTGGILGLAFAAALERRRIRRH